MRRSHLREVGVPPNLGRPARTYLSGRRGCRTRSTPCIDDDVFTRFRAMASSAGLNLGDGKYLGHSFREDFAQVSSLQQSERGTRPDAETVSPLITGEWAMFQSAARMERCWFGFNKRTAPLWIPAQMKRLFFARLGKSRGRTLVFSSARKLSLGIDLGTGGDSWRVP